MNGLSVFTIWEAASVVIVIGVLTQIGLVTCENLCRVRGRARKEALDLQLLQTELKIVRDLRRKRAECSLSWSGYRKFLVARKVKESEGVCSFYLSPHDGKPVPDFMPGQYLTFRLDIPGGTPAIRCYSLSDCPRSDGFRVTVKRIPSPDNMAPPGLASSFLHDRVNEGDILDVKAPSGNFYLDPGDRGGLVLIGGGIGITPVLAMLNTLVSRGSRQDIWFFYGIRNRAEHTMKDHLETVARENPNLHLHVCASQPDPDHVIGRDYHHQGRVSVELFKQLLPSNNFNFYICGPGSMMQSMIEGLKEWGVPENKIHFETFGPSSVKKVDSVAAPAAGLQTVFNISFKKSGKAVRWTGDKSNLLELAESNGIAISCGCRAGSCGTCRIAVYSGEIDYTEKPDYETEPGTRLTCIGIPKSDLVLDA